MKAKPIKYVIGIDGESHGVLSEQDTRRKLLNTARYFGFENEVKSIMARTDALLRNCTNQQEREQIAAYGALEIHQLLGAAGTLEVNGKKIS